MKKIGILGSTGSIGVQTLEVLDYLSDSYQIEYLSAKSNVDLLIEQVKKYCPKYVCIIDKSKYSKLKNNISNNIKIISGTDELHSMVLNEKIDIVLNAIVGSAGMQPTLNAIANGVDVALSNKESLVMAGHLINKSLEKNKVNLFPVDSEHSAIWECLKGEKRSEIKRILLTGSGGPFRKKKKSEFNTITLEQSLQHPNWEMGKKITIDSATMMNKGLEVIEAYWLFNINWDKIDIIVHPQSIIHSMVEFNDGSIKAQLGNPSMKHPIQYALTYPNHLDVPFKELNFFEIEKLTFEKPDFKKFKCMELAYNALKKGGSYPVVLNVANDYVVNAFLNQKIKFTDIPILIENAMDEHNFISNPDIEQIYNLMDWTGEYINKNIEVIC